RVGDFLHPGNLVAISLPIHREVFVGPHAAVLGRQIADVAVRGEDFVVLAEVTLDGLRLGGRLYDDELHERLWLSLRVYARGWWCSAQFVKRSDLASSIPAARANAAPRPPPSPGCPSSVCRRRNDRTEASGREKSPPSGEGLPARTARPRLPARVRRAGGETHDSRTPGRTPVRQSRRT